MKKLSKEEMKKVMGGEIEFEVDPGDGDGNCQDYLQRCETAKQLNCCSGYTCANYKCQVPTLA